MNKEATKYVTHKQLESILDKKLSNFVTKVEFKSLENRVAALEARMEALENRVAALEAKVDLILEKLNKLII